MKINAIRLGSAVLKDKDNTFIGIIELSGFPTYEKAEKVTLYLHEFYTDAMESEGYKALIADILPFNKE